MLKCCETDLISLGKFLKKIQIERGPTTPRNPTQASKRDCTPGTFKYIYNPNPTTMENRTALLIVTMIGIIVDFVIDLLD